MGRTRIISANKALYVTATGLLPSFYTNVAGADISGVKATQLHRIDTLSFDTDLAGSRTDVREFGRLARLASLRTSDITPTVSLGYYLTNGENEHHLGLNISGLANNQTTQSQFISGVLTEDAKKRARNLYVLVSSEGEDAFTTSAAHVNNVNHDVITFGNATLSNYSIDLSVGEIPRADIELTAANVGFVTGHNSGTDAFYLYNPALTKDADAAADTGTWTLAQPDTGNTDVDVLKPGDVTVSFYTGNNVLISGGYGPEIGGVDLSDICIQSLTLDLPLSRTPIECLGEKFAASQSLDFPIDVTMSINALVKDFASGSLQQVLLNAVDGQKQDIVVTIKNRNNSSKTAIAYTLKNAILDSQNFSIGLDDNETVDLQYSAQIGGASANDAGLFVSGDYIWDVGAGYAAGSQGFDPENPEWNDKY